MSDILETESNAVITVKKTFNQFVKFYGFWSSEKNAAGGVSIWFKQIMPVQH